MRFTGLPEYGVFRYRTPEEFAREVGGEEGCGKDAAWKSLNSDFSTPLGNPAEAAGLLLFHSHGGDGLSNHAVSNPNVVV